MSPRDTDLPVLIDLEHDSDLPPTSEQVIAAVIAELGDNICFCEAVDANGSPLNMRCPMHFGGLQ